MMLLLCRRSLLLLVLTLLWGTVVLFSTQAIQFNSNTATNQNLWPFDGVLGNLISRVFLYHNFWRRSCCCYCCYSCCYFDITAVCYRCCTGIVGRWIRSSSWCLTSNGGEGMKVCTVGWRRSEPETLVWRTENGQLLFDCSLRRDQSRQ